MQGRRADERTVAVLGREPFRDDVLASRCKRLQTLGADALGVPTHLGEPTAIDALLAQHRRAVWRNCWAQLLRRPCGFVHG